MKKEIRLTIITSMFLQVVTVIYGFIVPNSILATYGSIQNGLISSIEQVLSYAVLFEMGIGNVTVSNLFHSLEEKNYNSISETVSAAQKLYRHNGIIYSILCICIGLLYSYWVSNQVLYHFTFTLFIILSSKYAIDFFIVSKYKTIFVADRKLYFYNLCTIIQITITTLLSIILIHIRVSVLIVKMILPITYLVEAIYIRKYTKHNYSYVSFNCKKTPKIPQQLDSFVHQLCSFITYNTDIVFISVMVQNSLLEISVYSVYALSMSMLVKVSKTMTDGMQSFFGKLIANGKKIDERFNLFESIFMPIIFTLYSCYIVLVPGFSYCFSRGSVDVSYVRPTLGFLFGISGLLAAIKDHYCMLIYAYGEYKKTVSPFVCESICNILLTIVFIPYAGINGAVLATLISHAIAFFLILYMFDKAIQHGFIFRTYKRTFVYSVILIIVIYYEGKTIHMTTTWIDWMAQGSRFLITNLVLFFLIGILIDNKTWRRRLKNE